MNELMWLTHANISGAEKLNRLATVGSEQKPEEVSIVVSLKAKYPQQENCQRVHGVFGNIRQSQIGRNGMCVQTDGVT